MITKTRLKREIEKAISYNEIANLENFALFNTKPAKGVEVQFKYCGTVKFVGHEKPSHMFAMIDLHDPYYGRSHGYPKYYDGDIDAFYAEFQRELNYIVGIHNSEEE